MNASLDAPAGGVRVASAIPGRLRLRAVGPSGRERLTSVADAMRAWPETTSVQMRPQSLSLVVGFDPEHTPTVADRLAALGVELPAAGRSSPIDPADAMSGAVGVANRAVARRLDGTDLRSLVPLGLGLLAARRAIRGDERLADAPWYVLAWYASETFLKFHGGAATTDRRSQDEET